MKTKLLSFFILALIPSMLFASKVDKGFKALEKENFEKAADFFHDQLAETSVSSASNYGLSLVYGNDISELFNLPQAYNHAAVALEQYKSKKGTNKADLKEQGITYNDILEFKLVIEDRILEAYIDSNTVSALDEYIDHYDDAENLAQAKRIRNQLAYSYAKSLNTLGALQFFIEKYPDAVEVDVAIQDRNKLAYDSVGRVNTIEAFDYYLKNYPDANQIELIMERRNGLAYIDLLEKQSELDSLKNERAQMLIEKVENEKKQQGEIHSQNIMILSIALGAAGLLLVLIILGYNQKRKSNHKIRMQKETIELKNNQIVDSINYAKKIQEAILPDPNQIKPHFPESFIFYKPRDIVSGDFYWFEETEDKIFIAAVDCTGHGVPGAFMSMIGNTLLNQTVHVKGKTKPSEILFELRLEVIKALKQTGDDDEAKDGMDMALVSFTKDKKSIEFSGAFNPLYLVRDGEVQQLKGDRQPISKYFGKDDNPFTNHQMDIQQGDSIYIFTDGFADQFGGPKEKKFSYRKLRELLVSIQKEPASNQKQKLKSEIESWMQGYDQVDDMLIIGITV